MSFFTGEVQISDQDIYTANSAGGIGSGSGTGVQFGRFRLGQRGVTKDGRVFRYARIGAVAAVAGSLYQSSAPVPNHLAMTPSAASIGATSVSLTLGATAATANQYAEGYLQVDTTPGNGISYLVQSHAAIGSAGTGTINIDPESPIQVALTGSSRVGLIANPYADLIVCPTTVTAVPMGVPLVAAGKIGRAHV